MFAASTRNTITTEAPRRASSAARAWLGGAAACASPRRWTVTRLAVRDEEGAVTAEYAILLALVAIAVIAACVVLGLAVAHLFDTGTGAFPHA